MTRVFVTVVEVVSVVTVVVDTVAGARTDVAVVVVLAVFYVKHALANPLRISVAVVCRVP